MSEIQTGTMKNESEIPNNPPVIDLDRNVLCPMPR